LVRAGAFIPMINDIQSTEDYDSSKLTVHYYADKSVASANYEMYEDDGKTHQAIDKGLFELLQFSAKQQDQQLSIKLNRKNQLNSQNQKNSPNKYQSKIKTGRGYVGMPKQRTMSIVIHNWKNPVATVNLNNKKIKDSVWHEKAQTLTITFAWQHQPLTLTIN
jgi:oligosaccharide 4-alpha-D-glucosyltransferase